MKIICDKMDVPFEEAAKAVGERLGQDSAYIIDSGKARSELGWKPGIDLHEGLKIVIDWVEREWDSIRNESLEYRHKP